MNQQAIRCLWKILFSANPLYSQPIKETRLGLAGPNVYAKIPACIPKARARISTPQRRSRTEDNRPQCTSARTAALVVSSSLVFANRTSYYTPDLVPSLHTTQHTLGKVYNSKERANNRKLETSILPVELFVQYFALHNTNTLADIHAIVDRSSPSPPVKHTCEETFYPGSEIRPTTRALSRLPPSTSPPSHHDGGVGCSPSVSRGLIPLRLYNFLSQVGSSRAFGAQKLPGASGAASSK
ncbi:hypothetical protein PCH_Pc17g01110 [Penicillium rubens Wisconsin 54-1255]|uniref:Uncharacterized protein n=1 Tax=Penicillium rubens (strain ATCC 28089 / DSM 1075 / NRRL 1951 / Wisconsin 54-1255) TaxID=500485 RepID=B6HB30_PENRW|nr:hypothetical protein PCH_Pc17g01110 [Penicillium rubens Wisconsin 54-1255]